MRQPIPSFGLATSILVAVLYTPPVLSAEQNTVPGLYRYKDERGTMVTSSVIPLEYRDKGYQIVTPRGDVLQTIPPAPTKEERLAQLEKQRSDEEQAIYDKKLMLKYGNLAELRRAQERKLEELEGKLTVLNGNLSNIQIQIENEQHKAAGYERQGRGIPEHLLTTLDELYGNLEKTESLVKRREKELTEESERFAYETKRFKEIKGLR